MSIITQIFEHKRPIALGGMGSLIGDIERGQIDVVTTNAWVDIASASIEIGETSLANINIAEFDIVLDGKTFIVPIYDWTALTPQSSGTAISTGNSTALRAYERDGNAGVYILIGRSDGNIPLIQQGEGLNPSGNVRIELYTTETTGGLIDRLINGTGQRQLIVMQCDQDARPNPPPHGTDLRHNGKEPVAATLSTGEVWWPSGNRIRSLTTKTWFAFGEAVYDNLQGIWRVVAAWYILDQSDRTNIQFSRNWFGPWGTGDYVAGADNYARIRRSDGSYIVRHIGVDGAGNDKRLIPLTEQYIDGSSQAYEPYTVRTNFDLHPSEWDFMVFEWSWANASSDVDGITYYRKVSAEIPAADIIGSPMQTRTATSRIAGNSANSWTIVANSNSGMHAIRQAPLPTGLTGMAFSFQFESSDSSDHEPITHIRLLERQSSSLSTTGWFRTYVI